MGNNNPMAVNIITKEQAPGKPGKSRGGVKSKLQSKKNRVRKPIQKIKELDQVPTSDITQKICAAVRAGSFLEVAAIAVGITRQTLHNWIKWGKADKNSLYGAFFYAVCKALCESELRDVLVIDHHANGRPAEYEMEPVRDGEGKLVYDDNGKMMMQIARDGSGDPIIKRSEIKSDWKAAAWRLQHKAPKRWALNQIEPDEAERLMQEAIGVMIPNDQGSIETTMEVVKTMLIDHDRFGAAEDA